MSQFNSNDLPTIQEVKLDRRGFLRKAGVVGAALPVAGGLIAAACYDDPSGAKLEPAGIPASNVQPNPNPTPTPSGQAAAEEWKKIDADHQAGVVNFLKNQKEALTEGRGNVPLEARIENGVKVWDLTVDEVDWEVAPGRSSRPAATTTWSPARFLRGTVGDRVRINVQEHLEHSTSVHWHGIYVPNNMDGVPFLTQEPIQPGGSFTYEFTLRNSGSHMYHSHHDSADQVNRGLLGAFIVEPQDKAAYPPYDREVILIMNDSLLGFTLNGKGFPPLTPRPAGRARVSSAG